MNAPANLHVLTPQELAARLADTTRPAPLLLDVREDWEFEHAHLANATHIPMAMIPAHVAELRTHPEIVCICHHGIRSMQVAVLLARQGCSGVFNLAGGVDAWARDVAPHMPRY